MSHHHEVVTNCDHISWKHNPPRAPLEKRRRLGKAQRAQHGDRLLGTLRFAQPTELEQIKMIKVLQARYLGNHQVELVFSDGKEGVFDGSALLLRTGTLVEALRDETYFKRLYIDAGALCWPNGLELAPSRLYEICMSTALS